MTPYEYQKLAERTSATNWQSEMDGATSAMGRVQGLREIRLLHGAMGLCTEAGEFQDILKKWIFYGKEYNAAHLVEEIGDILWYCAEICNALDINMETVMQTNIAKLRVRYPEKFSEKKAIDRDLESEQKALQG